jgi:hypothetical protein
MQNQRGNSIFDVRSWLFLIVIYDLPFAKGNRFIGGCRPKTAATFSSV